jgi:hypothetical protein
MAYSIHVVMSTNGCCIIDSCIQILLYLRLVCGFFCIYNCAYYFTCSISCGSKTPLGSDEHKINWIELNLSFLIYSTSCDIWHLKDQRVTHIMCYLHLCSRDQISTLNWTDACLDYEKCQIMRKCGVGEEQIANKWNCTVSTVLLY